MSKLKTEADIQDFLDKELTWRILEISNIKGALANASGPKKWALIRAGIPLLYAHWEGFVKSSSKAYLEFVLSQRHKFNELKPCFTAHGFKKELNLLIKSNKQQVNIKSIGFIISNLSQRANFDPDSCITTKSNLNYELFENILFATGIEKEKYETKNNFIDITLLKRRNSIAHGEFLDVDLNDFFEICEEVTNLLRSFKTDIENSISLKTYRI